MFHIEIRMGMQVVRRFNLDDQQLWTGFLEPLMSGREFSVEGHEFVPRGTRMKIYEGPELRPHELGMGRGWQNVERTAAEVTERVLRTAREHQAGVEHAPAASAPAPAPAAAQERAKDLPGGLSELLRERLIGRLHAGALSGEQITAMAVELLPGGDERTLAELSRTAVWEVLERGGSQLSRSER